MSQFNSASATLAFLEIEGANTPEIPRGAAVAVTGTVSGTSSSSAVIAITRLLLMLA